jgi:hypothetical protein
MDSPLVQFPTAHNSIEVSDNAKSWQRAGGYWPSTAMMVSANLQANRAVRQIPTISILAVLGTTTLIACSPPTQQTLAACRSTAISEGRGHSLDVSDVGELTEACMLAKGYALKEDGALCSDNTTTTTNSNCYYPDTILGRLGARFFKD